MANESKPAIQSKGLNEKKDKANNTAYAEVLYSQERVTKYLQGHMTLAELTNVTAPEMLEMATYGFQMFENGKYKEARVIFDGLVTLDPNEPYYLTALGAIYLAEEDLAQAEAYFNRAIKLEPKDLAPYVNRGEVFLRQGKVLEAAQDFKKAVEMDPQGKDPLSMRARLLAAAALETIEAAQAQTANKK
jgi:Flp pilus assembly protein TadD